MNHKWKKIGGRSVKAELGRKECVNCKLQWRRIRCGGAEPHKGWTESQYRAAGKGTSWQRHPDYKVPPCEASRECPTCKGTGRLTRKELKQVETGSMDVEQELLKMESIVNCLPGTIIQRVFRKDSAELEWCLGLGCLNEVKEFYYGNTIQECLEKARNAWGE